MLYCFLNDVNTFRAFSADVAAENKRRGQPYRTLPYSIELRPKMGTFKEQEFNRGFVVLPRNVS